MTPAAQLLDAIVPLVRTRLPRGVDVDYLDDFLARNRFALEAVIEQNLGPVLARMQVANRPFIEEDIPEFWTVSKRTAANIAAMAVAANLYAQRRLPTADERATLTGYSGWGGLSIQAASGKFPAGFPVPEERGLIHEFYTPSKVAREVARVVAPLVHTLPQDNGTVHALEPSAGIGRFLHAFGNVPGLTWHAVEWSTLSSLMLKALRPELDLTNAPFERWVREKGGGASGRLGLVVSNPPYGARGASIAEDPDRAYREKMAYHYFLRRGLDLLAPDGLGVFLVPGGFLTSRTARTGTMNALAEGTPCHRTPARRPGATPAAWTDPRIPRPAPSVSPLAPPAGAPPPSGPARATRYASRSAAPAAPAADGREPSSVRRAVRRPQGQRLRRPYRQRLLNRGGARIGARLAGPEVGRADSPRSLSPWRTPARCAR